MFVKTIEGVYVNLLGADAIAREDNKSGSSKFIIRHGNGVLVVGVLPGDKPGSPRREAFEIVESFIERMRLVPESMSASMLPEPKEPVKEKITITLTPEKALELLKQALERIKDLERELDTACGTQNDLEATISQLQDKVRDYGSEVTRAWAEHAKLAGELSLRRDPPASGCPSDCTLPHSEG